MVYFSYAFFVSKNEEHGKLNITAGTLNYKIESSELVNNCIMLDANTNKIINIKITSLNNIDSKYLLYYETDNDNVEIVYAISSDFLPEGEIGAKYDKTVKLIIRNQSNLTANVEFKIIGGLLNNDLALSSGNRIDPDVERVVTFNTNGGSLTEENKFYEYGESLGELPVPTNELNYFAGWYLDSSFNSEASNDYIVTENLTLYARWYTYVDLYLGSRTRGYPSNTNFSNSTSRTFNLNTYVVWISTNNYYQNLNSGYTYAPPNFSVTVGSGGSGYGIGIPISVTSSTYYFEGITNDVYSFSFYKSNGEFISYLYLFNNGLFNVPTSASIMLLHMRGNEYKALTTYSQPTLYIVK